MKDRLFIICDTIFKFSYQIDCAEKMRETISPSGWRQLRLARQPDAVRPSLPSYFKNVVLVIDMCVNAENHVCQTNKKTLSFWLKVSYSLVAGVRNMSCLRYHSIMSKVFVNYLLLNQSLYCSIDFISNGLVKSYPSCFLRNSSKAKCVTFNEPSFKAGNSPALMSS